MWKMINTDNAIEAMAVTVRFSEPLSSIVLKRAIRELERTTSTAGLINRQAVQGFQVDLQSPAGNSVRQIPMQGMIFQRTSLTRVESGVVQQLAQQVEFQPTHISITTWRYRKWALELETIIGLLQGAFPIITDAVALAAIRIEYMDRFYFDGDPGSSALSDLLSKGTDFLAPHIFSAPSLWHSHTGRFDQVELSARKLLQVNADSQELSAPAELVGRHSVSVVTATEWQFSLPGLEVTGGDAINFLSSNLDDLHASAIGLFREVVDKGFQDKHGLSK